MSVSPPGESDTATGRLDVGEGWQRTHPLGIAVQGLRGLQQAILPIAAILFSTRSADIGGGMALAVGAAIVALNVLVTFMAWRNTQYRIGDTDIRVHKGILGRQARSVPFERIQDVSLEQRFVARLLSLVEVRFETGAGGKDELTLTYVSQAEGDALREMVRARIDPSRDANADAPLSRGPAAEPDAKPLFAMGPRRILIFGMFEFSLVVFAVLAGAAQQFDFLLPFDLWNFDEWERRLAGPGAWLAGLGPAARIVGALFAICGLAIVGLTTGIVRTFTREFGFRLDQTAQGFRRRRGLFTRTDVVMPVHRVQALTISTGFLRRLWGWHGLAFISLAHDAKSSSHDVAPFASLDEIAPIASAAGRRLPDANTPWHRPCRRYRIDRTVLVIVPPILVALIAAAIGETMLLVCALALGAILGGRRHVLGLRERHALDERQVLSMKGWLAPRLQIAAREKLHSVSIVQGPFARVRGYADVKFGLAGGYLSFRGLKLYEAREARAAVLDSLAAIDFSNLPTSTPA